MINLIHFFSTFWMLVVIWFVQVLHCPIFLAVPKEARVNFAHHHQTGISFLVMPAMLIELFSLVLLWSQFSANINFYICTISLIIIWISTFILQVPCHNSLLINPTDRVINKLVSTNWIRTTFWTIKSIAAFNLFSTEFLL